MTDMVDNPGVESGVIGMARRADVRNARRRQVEQLVASGMDVSSWCELNRVDKGALYDWMREFRESDPDVFGGYEIAHAGDGRRNWYECVRKALRASTAIERAGKPSSPAAAATVAFAVVDTAALDPAQPASPAAAKPITVRMRGISVDVPPGSARSDVAAVLSAVASL